jgi:hypothetical protein
VLGQVVLLLVVGAPRRTAPGSPRRRRHGRLVEGSGLRHLLRRQRLQHHHVVHTEACSAIWLGRGSSVALSQLDGGVETIDCSARSRRATATARLHDEHGPGVMALHNFGRWRRGPTRCRSVLGHSASKRLAASPRTSPQGATHGDGGARPLPLRRHPQPTPAVPSSRGLPRAGGSGPPTGNAVRHTGERRVRG